MRASLHTTALTALTLIASSALATAAEVRVLTVGSTQVAAKAIAADFEKQTLGPGADSEEKHEPASDIDTVAVDSLKALDPKWPIGEADISRRSPNSRDL